MNQNMIDKYLSSLTVEGGKKMALQYGISFNDSEASYIINFLKKHSKELDVDHIDYLLSLAKNDVSSQTLSKIKLLLSKFIK